MPANPVTPMTQPPGAASQKDFDPYHRWLGVPPGARPPTHYQLLGVAPGEADAEVIHAAAVRQTAYVRNFQSGPRAADASRVLSELAEARLTLTDPARRRQYDARLAAEAECESGDAAGPGEEVGASYRTGRGSTRSRAFLLVCAATLAAGAVAAAVGLWPSRQGPAVPQTAAATLELSPVDQDRLAAAAVTPPARPQRTETPPTAKPAEAVVGGAAASAELLPARTYLTDLPAPAWSAAYPAQKLGEHSFSMHPPGRDRGHAAAGYEVGGGYRTFHATATVLRSAPADSNSPMVFAVFGDGNLLWASGPLQRRGESDECACDVTGVRRLELRVRCAAGNGNAWGAWIDPHLLACDARATTARAVREKRPLPPGVEAEEFWRPAPPRPAAKPRLIALYKVVSPGDVVLTTSPSEVEGITKRHPGELKGDRGSWSGRLGFAYAERQEGTALLRRYRVGGGHVFSTRKLDKPDHAEEGLGAWVPLDAAPGAALHLGFVRRRDSAREYGPEDSTKSFGRLGYQPSELKFYLFDKGESP